eukprot:jgi/Bigna1/132962/aug1.19_g7670
MELAVARTPPEKQHKVEKWEPTYRHRGSKILLAQLPFRSSSGLFMRLRGGGGNNDGKTLRPSSSPPALKQDFTSNSCQNGKAISREELISDKEKEEEELWAVTTLVGGNPQPDHLDGPCSSAAFRNPEAICYVPHSRTLFVAEPNNYNVRVIDPNGNVNTMINPSIDVPFSRESRRVIPYGVKCSSRQNCLYIANVMDHNVVKVLMIYRKMRRQFREIEGVRVTTTGAL